MRWLRALIVGWLALLGLVRERRRRKRPRVRIVAADEPSPRAELLVVALLLAAALASAGFVVAYALDAANELLGGTLAAALALVGVALAVASRQLVVNEELEEDYAEPHPDEQEAVARLVTESGSRLTRKRLLTAAAGTAGCALGVALLAPAVSLGPLFDSGPLYATPWRRGRRLVGEDGRPLAADAVEAGTFYTAFPEGARREDLGASLVVVRVAPGDLDLPPGREGWAPEGIVAYSKICTHAGCAIALYRAPTFPATQPRPALVCPCHYSTFDPAAGAAVLFGPAGRPLPQLPLAIDGDGLLRAAGNYSGPVGPSWSGVRSQPAS
jgi:ubiquinol-cytochrome c reductase iron-sulfur subunit